MRPRPIFEDNPSCLTIRLRWIVAAITFTILPLVSIAPRVALAQASAAITGTVLDNSGAVLPGARVTVTNQDTGTTFSTVTSSAGTYTDKGLLPGHYSVKVDAAGFKSEVKKDIPIEVSTAATIDFSLEPGATSETVQVTASEIALNTTQPELGSTIEPVVAEALPQEVSGRGRQVDNLQFLAPGTTGNSFSHRVSGGVDFEQEIVYNGIPAPQPETQGYTVNFNPPYELMSEQKVERSNFSAQYGLAQGVLTYQMKSGTNQYHGDLFEINRNSFFDSVGFFNGPAWNSANVHNVAPADRENNYGFAVGGPIVIPHLYNGRNRTFGYYAQEWYKQNQEDTDSSTVPTAAEKTGDFSDFIGTDPSTGNAMVIPIFVPPGVSCNGLPVGSQFPGNVIPSNCISATSSILIPSIPDPDRTGSGAGNLDSNKSFTPFINPHIQHVWGFTVDHTLTAKQTLHYAQWRNSYSNYSFDYAPLAVNPNPLNSMKYDPSLGSVFLLNYSNAISPHLVMTAGVGWIGELNDQYNITKGYSFPAVTNENIPPNITWDGQHAPTGWGTEGSWFQSINRKLGIAIVNNWLWTKGRNTFNIGGEYRRAYQDDNEEQQEGGQFAFSQRTTSSPQVLCQDGQTNCFGSYGSSFASFLLGLPDYAVRSNSNGLYLRNRLFAPYIQDDIKLTPRLTLNVGVRWDIQVPFTENTNQVVFLDPDNPGTNPADGIPGAVTKLGTCAGCAGFSRADIHWGHFGPRFGFAYQLSSKTVVQAGLDIAFLDGGAYEYGTSKVAVNYAKLLSGSFTRNSTGSNQSPFGNWDTTAMPALNPTAFNPSLGVGTQIDAFSRKDGYAPYTQQWNINVQHELPYNVLLSAAYVGNRIIHLPSQNNRIDQMDPAYDAQYGSVLSNCPGNAGNSVLTDTFSSGCAQIDGFSLPYANFITDFADAGTVAQSLVPYPQYSYIFNNFEASGTTFYNSAQIEIEKRYSSGLSFLAGYTLSRLLDNTSSGFTTFTSGGINRYNQRPEYSLSNADEPQTLKVSGTYELPIGPGKTYLNNHTTANLLGGWQVGWVLDYEAGTSNGPSENGSPFPNGFNRPDRNSAVGLSTASYSRARDYFLGKIGVAQMYNPAAFTLTPSQYVIGNAVRSYGGMRNAPFYSESLNARKHFYLGERVQGLLQVDYFNAINRTIFNGPDNNASDGTFGQITSEGSNISNRQGQVQFRLEF